MIMNMKKTFVFALVVALALALALFAACDRDGGAPGPSEGGEAPAPSPAPTLSPTPAPSPVPTSGPADDPAPELTFDGKIAIVTYDSSGNMEEYSSAEALQKKYGEDKIIHRVWPVNFSAEGEQMVALLLMIAEDPDVKAIVLNGAVVNSNAAVDALLEARPDIFVAYCNPAESPQEVVGRANLSIAANEQLRAETIVMQAKAMGANVFVHYSFPRHMAVPALSQRRDDMKDVCETEGMTFVDLTAIDPWSEAHSGDADKFILDDVREQVAEWGRSTAFFSPECALQDPLIARVIQTGAIYPEPCHPSPYHGFPEALDIASTAYYGVNIGVNEDGMPIDLGNLKNAVEIIEEIRSVIDDLYATGRLATWPMPLSMMSTAVATEYAIRWINGEVPREKGDIDYAVFEELCEAYIFETTGRRLGVEANPLSLTGRSYNSYLLVVMDSLVF